MNPQRLVLAMTGCVMAALSSACQLDPGVAERDGPRVAQESSPVQATEAVSPGIPINGGYPYFADVDLQVTGTPEVGGHLTVTAYFTVPVDSLALKPGSREFDLVVGLYFGDYFDVKDLDPPCDICGDGETGLVEYSWLLSVTPGVMRSVTVDLEPLEETASFRGIEVVVSDASDLQTAVVRARNIRIGPRGRPGEIQ